MSSHIGQRHQLVRALEKLEGRLVVSGAIEIPSHTVQNEWTVRLKLQGAVKQLLRLFQPDVLICKGIAEGVIRIRVIRSQINDLQHQALEFVETTLGLV